MLYGSLNNWKCASIHIFFLAMHIRRIVRFSSILLVQSLLLPFYRPISSLILAIFFSSSIHLNRRHLYEKICFILANGGVEKERRVCECLAAVSVLSNTVCEELVMVHDAHNMHTLQYGLVVHVHGPYSTGHFQTRFTIRRFNSHYQCH